LCRPGDPPPPRPPLPFTAQVTENVFDSPTGRFLLIPQATRLIGIYDSQVAFGQSRFLLVWTRLIMPNGRSIVLERQAGVDTAGYAGVFDGSNPFEEGGSVHYTADDVSPNEPAFYSLPLLFF
jgi:hypothetical protein